MTQHGRGDEVDTAPTKFESLSTVPGSRCSHRTSRPRRRVRIMAVRPEIRGKRRMGGNASDGTALRTPQADRPGKEIPWGGRAGGRDPSGHRSTPVRRDLDGSPIDPEPNGAQTRFWPWRRTGQPRELTMVPAGGSRPPEQGVGEGEQRARGGRGGSSLWGACDANAMENSGKARGFYTKTKSERGSPVWLPTPLRDWLGGPWSRDDRPCVLEIRACMGTCARAARGVLTWPLHIGPLLGRRAFGVAWTPSPVHHRT